MTEESKIKATAAALSKLDIKDFKYHQLEVQDVLKELGTNLEKGLTAAQHKERLEKYGLNQLDKEEDKSLWERIKEAFEDLLVRILLLSAFISFLIALSGGEDEGLTAYVEPFVILLILLINAIIAIY